MIVRHRYPATAVDRSFDRVFEQLTNSFFDTRRQVGPTVAGTWNDDEYELTIDLPGVPADAVTVEVTGSTLMLGAATDTMQWQRSLELGGRLDPEKVTASHVDGRLTVHIGSYDTPAPRRVQIETSPAPAAIEATSGDSTPEPSTDD